MEQSNGKQTKKNKKKQQTPKNGTDDDVPSASAEQQDNLFPTVQLKSGAVRTIFNTNDTTEMLQPIPTKVVNERLDTVLDAVRQLDTTCDYARCRTKTSLMHMDCSHCQLRYCIKHGLPEVHGCGEAIKRQEQADFRHPVPHKTKQAEKDLNLARQKMEQKLKDLNLARKAKPKTKTTTKKPAK